MSTVFIIAIISNMLRLLFLSYFNNENAVVQKKREATSFVVATSLLSCIYD